MKRVMITGARGFLGRRLVYRLAENRDYELVAVTSRPTDMDVPQEVSVEAVDLLDAASVESLMERVCPEVCVHLAWDQREKSYRSSLTNYQWLAASILLFSQFQAAGGRQFLFAGSSGEYEHLAGGMAETPGRHSMSLYGRCKKMASELFLNAETDMQVQIARFFTIYGPGDTHVFGAIPSAICTLLKGNAFSCLSPGEIRDYIYIDDAVEAVTRLLQSDFRGAVNIGSGIPRTMKEVFLEIGEQLGCSGRISFCGGSSGGTALFSDNTVLREALGFTPQTDFSDGIARSIAYWREQLGAEKVGA